MRIGIAPWRRYACFRVETRGHCAKNIMKGVFHEDRKYRPVDDQNRSSRN